MDALYASWNSEGNEGLKESKGIDEYLFRRCLIGRCQNQVTCAQSVTGLLRTPSSRLRLNRWINSRLRDVENLQLVIAMNDTKRLTTLSGGLHVPGPVMQLYALAIPRNAFSRSFFLQTLHFGRVVPIIVLSGGKSLPEIDASHTRLEKRSKKHRLPHDGRSKEIMKKQAGDPKNLGDSYPIFAFIL
ncbi:hypothetical protein K474DRAFT_868582 [Panus rudis PR-1116 ss-1]|nr:hypothetical protein K474DRAFT_868582 [Panus rudis PR-1116 ss-1]